MVVILKNHIFSTRSRWHNLQGRNAIYDRGPIDVLDDLADQVADEFEAYRQPDEFKDVSLVIENTDAEHPMLIVYVDKEDVKSLADRIDDVPSLT